MKEMRWPATINDISSGGVRLHLQRRFEKGTGLAIELPGKDEQEPSVVFVRVVHLKAHPAGGWLLGCHFVSELSEEEVESILASQQKRNEKKVLTNLRIQLAIRNGTNLNCVIKRLDVTSCWPLTPGKTIELNGSTPRQTKWSLKVQVVEFEEQAGGCNLLAKLSRSPSATDLIQALALLAKQ
jgi:hypothetical protein